MSIQFDPPIEQWENRTADEASDELIDELLAAVDFPAGFWPRLGTLTRYQRHVIASRVEWYFAQFSRLVRIGRHEGDGGIPEGEAELSLVLAVANYLEGLAEFIPDEYIDMREMLCNEAERWIGCLHYAVSDEESDS